MDKLHAPVRANAAGFTLIELMVAVAIAAILASLAIPSYTAYVARARRADARTTLMQAALFMGRFYAANDRFDADRSGANPIDQMSAQVKQSPAGPGAIYQLNTAVTVADTYTATLTASAYTLTMAPVAAGRMAGDTCGLYTLTSSGVKGNVDAGGSALTADQRDACWR